MLKVEIIKTASLGNRGYLVHDGIWAIAIDVQRDYDRWQKAAQEADVVISHVLETHMHNDYVTGGYKLAQLLNAIYVIPADSGQTFEAQEVNDGGRISVGTLKVTALHTPGHTPNHMSYVVTDGKTTAVYTGGSVLYGTVGRSDLISKDMTRPLTEAQYDSAQKLIEKVTSSAQLYPTHGFGSFCSSSEGSGAESSTLEDEKKTNIAYTSKDKSEFIETILSGLSTYPRYYAHMGKMNQAGPEDMLLKPIEKLSANKLKAMLAHDEWVVDIRDRKVYAARHPVGAAGFELADSFSSYIGWIIPWGDNITLVGDSSEDLDAAQTQLGRIGMDQFVGHVSDDMPAYFALGQARSYPIKKFNDLAGALQQDRPTIIDVRTPAEWGESHIDGATNIPLYDLLDRMDELPKDKTIWIHCGSGYRASIGASLVDKIGLSVALIDDDFSEAPGKILAKN